MRQRNRQYKHGCAYKPAHSDLARPLCYPFPPDAFQISLFILRFTETLTLNSFLNLIHLAFFFPFRVSSAYMVISRSVTNLSRQINLFFSCSIQQLLQWSSTLALKVAQKGFGGKKEADRCRDTLGEGGANERRFDS